MSRPKSDSVPPAEGFFLDGILDEKMHFYQFHIGDYKSHTHHLSAMEDLAYRRLLDHYYLHEQPIRQHEIARQIGMRDNEQDVLTVLDEFFVSTPNGYINPRADEEIAKYRKLSEDGKRGAAKRWAKAEAEPPQKGAYGEANSPPNATPIATNNQEPITNNHKPKVKTVATAVARPSTVDQQVWDDWLAIRRVKKLPLTATAWSQIEGEIAKAGHPVDVVIRECCLRGWGAFKANWLKDNPITVPDSARFIGDI